MMRRETLTRIGAAVGGFISALAIILLMHQVSPIPTAVPFVLVGTTGLGFALKKRAAWRHFGLGLLVGAIVYAVYLFLVMATLGESLREFEAGTEPK